MALEFLYAENDVPSLISALYDSEYYLSQSVGIYKDLPLSQIDAITALKTDLVLPGFTVYWVGRGENNQLLQFKSCGKQSHPSYVGKQGRVAGYLSISTRAEPSDEAAKLLKMMRQYLRKNGLFRRYNGSARMSCYYLPNYSQLEENYLQRPFPEYVCRGTIRVICESDQVAGFIEKLEQISKCYPAIENGNVFANGYRGNKMSVICFEFLCNHKLFSFSDLMQMIQWISENKKSAVCNQKLQMIAESPPMSIKNHLGIQASIVIFIDNPWQCWIDCESEYSGKTTILWPN